MIDHISRREVPHKLEQQATTARIAAIVERPDSGTGSWSGTSLVTNL